MRHWQQDKERTDRFLPAIKRILGEYLIDEAPLEEDRERNADLIVLRLNAVRIAVRLRDKKYFNDYCEQFTVRASRPSEQKTELDKIQEGWGDYFLYGFADLGNITETELYRWTLGSLDALRSHIKNCAEQRQLPYRHRKNNFDKSSDFVVFHYEDVPNYLVAYGEQEEIPCKDN